MSGYVLDTSAILTVLFGEEGMSEVEAVLQSAAGADRDVSILTPFMALMEVEYQLLRELDADEVKRWLNIVTNWPTSVIESSAEWRHRAATVKSRGKISLADAWVAALALISDAELVHKNPEFDAVEGLRALRLPYTTAKVNGS